MKIIALFFLIHLSVFTNQVAKAASIQSFSLPFDVLVKVSDIVIIGKFKETKHNVEFSKGIKAIITIDQILKGQFKRNRFIDVVFCGSSVEFYNDLKKTAPAKMTYIFFLIKDDFLFYPVGGIGGGVIPIFENHITYKNKKFTIEQFIKKIERELLIETNGNFTTKELKFINNYRCRH